MKVSTPLFCLWVLIAGNLAGQSSSTEAFGEVGLPYVQHIEVPGPPQNWEIVQDQRGFIYIANLAGIFEYDGRDLWHGAALPGQNGVNSLAVDDDNRIYVGAFGDFGYLAPDQWGILQFVSLLDQVPEAYRDFVCIWDLYHTSHVSVRRGALSASEPSPFRLAQFLKRFNQGFHTHQDNSGQFGIQFL